MKWYVAFFSSPSSFVVFCFHRLNPNYGPETDSTFILHCPAWELFDNDGLVFQVEDRDTLTPDDHLGTVRVPGHELCAGTGALMEKTIEPPKGKEGVDAGTLNIRCRRATDSDFESLKNRERKQLFS